MRTISFKIGLLIFFFIIIFYYIFQSLENSIDQEIELKNYNNITSTNKIEISNPTFKSKGLESDPYTIKAVRGVQEEDYIELYDVEAEVESENNKVFYVSAEKGIYDQKNGTIKLLGNVVILDELNNKTTTKEALIEIERKKLTLLKEVSSISSNRSVSSDFSIVDEINNTITYSGNLKVVIENE